MSGEEIIRLAFEMDGTKVQALSGSTLEVLFKGERKATKKKPAMPEHYRVTFCTRQKPLPFPGDDSMAGIIVWIPRKQLEAALSPVVGREFVADDGREALAAPETKIRSESQETPQADETRGDGQPDSTVALPQGTD